MVTAMLIWLWWKFPKVWGRKKGYIIFWSEPILFEFHWEPIYLDAVGAFIPDESCSYDKIQTNI